MPPSQDVMTAVDEPVVQPLPIQTPAEPMQESDALAISLTDVHSPAIVPSSVSVPLPVAHSGPEEHFDPYFKNVRRVFLKTDLPTTALPSEPRQRLGDSTAGEDALVSAPPEVSTASTVIPLSIHVLYVFCGKRRKSDLKACLEELCQSDDLELCITEFDTELDASHDVTDPRLWKSILLRISESEFNVVIVTPPCSTWSRVRFANLRGPKPVRDFTWPWGYPWLEQKGRAEAELGNLFVVQMLEACKEAHSAGAFFLCEHPENLGRTKSGHIAASIWQLQEVQSLANECGALTFSIFQCQFGAETSKPTRFLTTLTVTSEHLHQGWPTFRVQQQYSGPLPARCPHGFHAKKLLGQQNGVFLTAASANYPPELCMMLAVSIVESCRTRHSLKKRPTTVLPADEVTSDEEEDGFKRPVLRDHLGGSGPPMSVESSSQVPKLFQDGCGLCSPGRWHPEQRRPVSSLGKALKGLMDSWIAKHIPNVPRMVFQMASGKLLESPFPEPALQELRSSWFKLLPDPVAAEHVREFQPFHLNAIAQSLKLIGDPDYRVYCEAHFNFTHGVPVGSEGCRLPRTPAVFPRKSKWRKYDEGIFCPEMSNYPTAVATGDFLDEQFRKDEKEGMMFQCTLGEARELFGSKLRISAQGAVAKGQGDERSWRIVHDGTHGTKINHSIKPRDQLVVPSCAEAKSTMQISASERPGVHFSLVADIKQAHRRFVHDPADWGLLCCKSHDSDRVWVNRCGTFGISSAAYWWARLSSGIGRLAFEIWELEFAFQFLYADDLRWTSHGPNKYLVLIRALLLWVMAGAPMSWAKLHGGLSLDWVGFWLDYSRFKIGVSESRCAWVISWAQRILTDGVVLVRQMEEGLGRLGFTAMALPHIKPFLAPLYAWTSSAPGGAVLPVPKLCKITLLWISAHFETSRSLVDCSRARVDTGERFRTDAKGESEYVVLGGWDTSKGLNTRTAPWFSLKILRAEAPWLFRQTKRGVHSSPTISASELLSSLVATHLFIAPDSHSRGKILITGLTDNQGNESIMRKLMSTKMPVGAVLIQFALLLTKKDIDLSLTWTPRELNAEADALTNEDFSGFDEALRVRVELKDLDLKAMFQVLEAWGDLDEEIKKRRLDCALGTKPTGAHKKRKREKQPWGVR